MARPRIPVNPGDVFGGWQIVGPFDPSYGADTSQLAEARCMGCGVTRIHRVAYLRSVKPGGCKKCTDTTPGRGLGTKKPQRQGRKATLRKEAQLPEGTCMTKDRIYQIWNHAFHRCHSPGNAGYGQYGGRGLAMLDAWRKDLHGLPGYVAFRRYVLSLPQPYPNAALHPRCYLRRVDRKLGYEPNNLEWTLPAPMAEQRLPLAA